MKGWNGIVATRIAGEASAFLITSGSGNLTTSAPADQTAEATSKTSKPSTNRRLTLVAITATVSEARPTAIASIWRKSIASTIATYADRKFRLDRSRAKKM